MPKGIQNKTFFGSAQKNLSVPLIQEFSVPKLPIEEQKQIVEFIETATSKIDSTIATIKKEIGFLGEYRTALISEVVTGKIKTS
jgi:restriction endonuclease S subunit